MSSYSAGKNLNHIVLGEKPSVGSGALALRPSHSTFPNQEIEQFTHARGSIIPYRVLVSTDVITRESQEEQRKLAEEQRQLLQSQLACLKQHVGEARALARAAEQAAKQLAQVSQAAKGAVQEAKAKLPGISFLEEVEIRQWLEQADEAARYRADPTPPKPRFPAGCREADEQEDGDENEVPDFDELKRKLDALPKNRHNPPDFEDLRRKVMFLGVFFLFKPWEKRSSYVSVHVIVRVRWWRLKEPSGLKGLKELFEYVAANKPHDYENRERELQRLAKNKPADFQRLKLSCESFPTILSMPETDFADAIEAQMRAAKEASQ